jgi:polyhydroxybutyrate depolymerase
MRATVTTLLLAIALFLATAVPAQAQAQTITLTVDGVRREAILVLPSRQAPGRTPVLFAFHGAGDTAENFSGVGFHQAWPEAAVVYVQGVSRTPGRGGSFQTTDGSSANRDLKFFDALLVDVKRRVAFDERRVFATGFSNGAKFVYLLWAARPRALAALAPVAGMLTAPVTFTEPKQILHVGGRQDRQNDFALQLELIELARAANAASRTPVLTHLHDGGHTWPADTTLRIVEFFRARPAAPGR